MAGGKTIVLITGANGGLGFAVASQLLSASDYHVLLGSRSVEKGEAALKDLQFRNLPGTVELLQLDVTSEESITTAAQSVESKHGRLDVLVNSADIAGENYTGSSHSSAPTEDLLMKRAFGFLLKKSTGPPSIINASSVLGSVTVSVDGSIYPLSAILVQMIKSRVVTGETHAEH